MKYTFILSNDTRVDEIGVQLGAIEGITWGMENRNLFVEVPDLLSSNSQNQIFDAVAAGTASIAEYAIGVFEGPETHILCGALQSRLLDKHMPEAVSNLTAGIVIEVDSIDNELVMLRMRGPKQSEKELDRISAWLMSKCAVGVSNEN